MGVANPLAVKNKNKGSGMYHIAHLCNLLWYYSFVFHLFREV